MKASRLSGGVVAKSKSIKLVRSKETAAKSYMGAETAPEGGATRCPHSGSHPVTKPPRSERERAGTCFATRRLHNPSVRSSDVSVACAARIKMFGVPFCLADADWSPVGLESAAYCVLRIINFVRIRSTFAEICAVGLLGAQRGVKSKYQASVACIISAEKLLE